MPIDYVIDQERRLVIAKGRGIFTHDDVFAYQRDVWSRPEVAGFDELVDMSQVERIAFQSIGNVQELADLSAMMDSISRASRFAIVAPTGDAFGLGVMYKTYRSRNDLSTKGVRVFWTMDEALAYLADKGSSGAEK